MAMDLINNVDYVNNVYVVWLSWCFDVQSEYVGYRNIKYNSPGYILIWIMGGTIMWVSKMS